MDNKYGLVLDGEVAVGRFVFSTEENAYGQRQIMKLDLNSNYVDVSNGRTKNLRCLLVEKVSEDQINSQKINLIENPLCVKILEDLGVGTIEGKFSMDDKMAHYQKALFVKAKQQLNSKLN